MMPQPPAGAEQPQSGAPSVQDPTPAAVGGNIGPGNAPELGAEGFTGAGGGNNGGNPPLKPQAPNSPGISAQ